MTIEMCPAVDAAQDVEFEAQSEGFAAPAEVSMVESVAKVVSGISIIGQARNALHAAGWAATITANRITVDDSVVAQLIPARMGTYGMVNASWVISSTAVANPVWIVGTRGVSLSD